jgi:transcriptional regulator with XRE-family HTH domain
MRNGLTGSRAIKERKEMALGIKNNWVVEFHVEFASEFTDFSEPIRQMILSFAGLLRTFGPQLGRPQVDTLKRSRHSNMKELRFDADGGGWRVAFGFDSSRKAIFLVGGDKVGVSKEKFCRNLIELADRRFDRHQAAEAGKKRGKEMTYSTVSLDEMLARESEESRRRIEKMPEELIAEEVSLRELRLLRKLTQARLAKRLKIGQEGVSRIERRSDMNISTLSKYVKAVGATLRIEARFPDQPPIVLMDQGKARTLKTAQKKSPPSPKSKAKSRRAA